MDFQGSRFIFRITGYGVKLNDFEIGVLRLGLQNLPDHLSTAIKSHLEQYNLVQRESDGRAINFYRKKGFFRGLDEVSPLIDLKKEDAPILKLGVMVTSGEIVHAVFHVVDGRFFCVTFSESTKPFKYVNRPKLVSVTHSWRSVVRT